MELIQTITILKYNDGFVLKHKHKDFTEDAFLPKSNTGVLNSVENLLNGYLPDPEDTLLKKERKPNIHAGWWKEPRPLD